MWTGIYGMLAAASLVLATHQVRLKRLIKWFDWLSLARVASAAQRVLTGLYIGILTIAFVGVAGPSALTPTLQRQLKARYVVALQRQLGMEAETSAYNEIRAESNGLTAPSGAAILAYLVQEIHDDAHQRADAQAPREARNSSRTG